LEALIGKFVEQVDPGEARPNDDCIQVLNWLFGGTYADGYGKGVMRNLNERRAAVT
jgi:hypothetical protein